MERDYFKHWLKLKKEKKKKKKKTTTTKQTKSKSVGWYVGHDSKHTLVGHEPWAETYCIIHIFQSEGMSKYICAPINHHPYF